MTAVEMSVLRRLDRRVGMPTEAERQEMSSRVTIIVKTFERPRALARFVASARQAFDGRILVADDSRRPVTDHGEGVEVLALPFNVGLSVGRNAALDRVDSQYVFVSDDDIVVTAATDLVAMMNYLDDNPEVDIIAPQLINLPAMVVHAPRADALFPTAAPPLRPFGELIGGVPVAFKVPNVFLARTQSLRAVRWDERLRLLEHRDFFSRASGRLVTVQADAVRAYHLRDAFDPFYNAHRMDLARDFRMLAVIWGGEHRPEGPLGTDG